MRDQQIKDMVEKFLAETISAQKDAADPVPVAIPAELQKPESMDDKIRRIIATQISQQAAANGFDSWEEAHDFDVDDEFDSPVALSKYEVSDMETEFPQQMPNLDEEVKTYENNVRADSSDGGKPDDDSAGDIDSPVVRQVGSEE